MIKGGVEPCGGRVAHAAIARKTKLQMRRIVGACKIRAMACVAGCRCPLENIIDVAGCTSEGSVNPGQSKAGVFQMIVLCVVPTVHRVAGFTRSGESGAYMIENRSLKILLMA